jgi:thiosulfate/3-mercaptopyruvate sulfurtransferase
VQKTSFRIALFLSLAASSLAFLAAPASRTFARARRSGDAQLSDPWRSSQTVLPEALAKELSSTDGAKKPTVVCVGFHSLYEGAHIPTASFHGAGSTPQGIADLKTWAQDIPRSTNIVLYCGCCPLQHCPNLKPAFAAMSEMDFTNLRVLLLPNDFNTDWIEKGYPVEKGK